MNKEDLLKLKEKISKLTEEEQKQRKLYLRGLSNGEIEGPMTGYASIDQPQLAIYNKEEYFKDKKKETITEALFNNNKDNLDTVALNYFYSNIKYRKFFENIKNSAKALTNYGVKKGESVVVCLPGIPEAMTSIYSTGYIGAISLFMVPYLDDESMISDIKKNNSKVFIIMDLIYEKGKEKFDKIFEKAGIEHVVIVPTLNSSILGKLKKQQKYDNPKIELYDEFIKKGANTELPEMVRYEKDMPAAVVYTSGTSGILKGVLLSHDSINNIANSYKAFGFDLSRGQSIYQAIPTWTSTGLVAVGTIPLFFGATVYQNPKFDPITFSKNLGLKKINWGVGTTELFNGIEKIKQNKFYKLLMKLHIMDYSHLHTVLIGGTFASPKDKEKLNELLRELGSSARANSGYGTCENGSTVAAELNGVDYPDYSIGRPIPGTIVVAIDKECNELPYGVRGELAIKTECGMLSYYNRPDLDNIFFNEQGSNFVYKHTGDVGYVLPDGVVVYESRAKDVSVINGEEILNFDVKKVILKDKDVSDCEVFVNCDNKLSAHIVFFNKNIINVDEKLQELQSEIYKTYGNKNYVPLSFKIRDSFPMAASTKRDYAKIKSEQDGFTDVEFLNDKVLSKKNS